MLEENPYRIEILSVALDVIEFFLVRRGQPVGLSDVARAIDINTSRAFRILKTYEERGYVEYDSQTQSYRLGIRFLALGEAVRDQMDLRRIAEPILTELAGDTGDIAYLVVLQGKNALHVARYRGQHLLQVEEPLGRPLPLHVGASPKILLAYQPEWEREKLINQMTMTTHTANTITDREQLRDNLAQIRALGYSVDEEDYELGACAVGAPVWDHRGEVAAAISVVTPKARFSSERRGELIDMVVDAARRISTLMGNPDLSWRSSTTPVQPARKSDSGRGNQR